MVLLDIYYLTVRCVHHAVAYEYALEDVAQQSGCGRRGSELCQAPRICLSTFTVSEAGG